MTTPALPSADGAKLAAIRQAVVGDFLGMYGNSSLPAFKVGAWTGKEVPPMAAFVFSLTGGGVQSTAALVLAARGRIGFPVFLFANVGDDSEHPRTLRYLREIALPSAAGTRSYPQAVTPEVADLREPMSSRDSREPSRLDLGSRNMDLGSWISDARTREVTDLADRFGRSADYDKVLEAVIDTMHERTGIVIDGITARFIADDIRKRARVQIKHLRQYLIQAIQREKDPAGRWLRRPAAPAWHQPSLNLALPGGAAAAPEHHRKPALTAVPSPVPAPPGAAERGAALARELMGLPCREVS